MNGCVDGRSVLEKASTEGNYKEMSSWTYWFLVWVQVGVEWEVDWLKFRDSSYFANLKITVSVSSKFHTFKTGMLSPVREYIILDILIESLAHLIQVLEIVCFFLLGSHTSAGCFESSQTSPRRCLLLLQLTFLVAHLSIKIN